MLLDSRKVCHYCMKNDMNMLLPNLTTSPCYVVDYASLRPINSTWDIQVIKQFIINITVYKAFVPFSKDCNHNLIAINEEYTQLEQLCGHINMLSVLTKHNKANIYIRANSSILHLQITFHVSYEVMLQGSAFRFYKPCLPATFHLEGMPTNAVMNFHWYSSEYIWYLDGIKPKDGGFITRQVNISQLTSTSAPCSLSLYPSMLTAYWYN